MDHVAISHRTLATALLAGLLLAPAAAAQLHKDAKLGFQFKPPRDFKSVALTPSERRAVAKYQAEQMDFGGEQGYAGFNAILELQFYPKSALTVSMDGSAVSGDVTTTVNDPLESAMKYLEMAFGYYEVEKELKATIAGTKAREMHLTPATKPDLMVYVALVEQDDGVFLFEGIAVASRFKKSVSDFSKAARSLKRIDKADQSQRKAELSQLDEQERFLQTQIDKLPPGWSHLRTARYLFLYNAEKAFVKQMSEQIEGMRDVYEQFYPPDEPIKAISIVRVCNSFEEFAGYSGMGPGVAGYWASRERELVFFDMAPRTDTLAVLNHEAFHQFIFYFYGELAPHSWYNEGQGDYFGGAKLTKTYRVTGYGDLPGGVARATYAKDMVRAARQGKSLAEGAAAPLKELFRYHQPEYYDHRGDSLPVGYYPQGWAIVHMLRDGKSLDPKWQRILPDYLGCLLAARHEVAEATMKKALEVAEKTKKGSSEEMSKEVKDYYARVNRSEVQDLAYAKTFEGWSDDDWKKLQEAFYNYVEKL